MKLRLSIATTAGIIAALALTLSAGAATRPGDVYNTRPGDVYRVAPEDVYRVKPGDVYGALPDPWLTHGYAKAFRPNPWLTNRVEAGTA